MATQWTAVPPKDGAAKRQCLILWSVGHPEAASWIQDDCAQSANNARIELLRWTTWSSLTVWRRCSVFAEATSQPTQTGGEQPVDESARVGSSSAFSTVIDGHKITAVGEVPPATVRFIANSVQAGPHH